MQMDTDKNLCRTCRDFAVNGSSDSIEDIGQHFEWKSEVDAVLPANRFFENTEDRIDLVEACDVCGIEGATLHRFTITPEPKENS